MLEKNGVRIAAVSYDAPDVLQRFAEDYGIQFPLLSDRDSAVIRRFGIFNHNMAPGLRAYGVPHPVEYLVAPDGILIRKYFVENYQHRVTASAVVLHEFGSTGEDAERITLRSGAVTVEIGLSGARAFAGQEIGFSAKFTLEPGWHIYGSPLPPPYTATSITFDDPNIIRQSFRACRRQSRWRSPRSAKRCRYIAARFKELGSLLLKYPIDAGKDQRYRANSVFSNAATRYANRRRWSGSNCR